MIGICRGELSKMNTPGFSAESGLCSNYNRYRNCTRMAPNPQVVSQVIDEDAGIAYLEEHTGTVGPLGMQAGPTASGRPTTWQISCVISDGYTK
jgi:hypothetical protein